MTALLNEPPELEALRVAATDRGFTMSSDNVVGRLLAVLVSTKPGGSMLELGTGVGHGTAWLRWGLTGEAHLTTVERDRELLDVARAVLDDDRIEFVCADGADWLTQYAGPPFDLVFADTWPGKITHLDETLALVSYAGMYVVDDLTPQPTWPPGHAADITRFRDALRRRDDFRSVDLDAGTGMLIATRTMRESDTARAKRA